MGLTVISSSHHSSLLTSSNRLTQSYLDDLHTHALCAIFCYKTTHAHKCHKSMTKHLNVAGALVFQLEWIIRSTNGCKGFSTTRHSFASIESTFSFLLLYICLITLVTSFFCRVRAASEPKQHIYLCYSILSID